MKKELKMLKIKKLLKIEKCPKNYFKKLINDNFLRFQQNLRKLQNFIKKTHLKKSKNY